MMIEERETSLFTKGDERSCVCFICCCSAATGAVAMKVAAAINAAGMPAGAALVAAIRKAETAAAAGRVPVRRIAAALAGAIAPASAVTAAIPSAATRNITTVSTRSAANAKWCAAAAITEIQGKAAFARLFPRKRLPFFCKCCKLKGLCGCGETGRRAGLRIRWATLQVQILSSAPKTLYTVIVFIKNHRI